MDRLNAPWCSILGDHDVHEKTFANYLSSMMPDKHYAFHVGQLRFLALNAFDQPDPGSFSLLPEQLRWIENQLNDARNRKQRVVIFLHCYPSDLRQGRESLQKLVREPEVLLVEMGHTHYNEVSNDGHTLYSATRSTGQIEEGPVGFSIANVDGDVISWRFFEPGLSLHVMITSPADHRLLTGATLTDSFAGEHIQVRAKVWSKTSVRHVTASFEEQSIQLTPITDSQVWQGTLHRSNRPDGRYNLTVIAEDEAGRKAEDSIRIIVGAPNLENPKRAQRDQDNALAAWPEHGLLGTQLGPNKNGRKW